MNGYSAQDVAAMLRLSVRQVRSYAVFLAPAKGERGEYRFTFQDLVLLRTAKELVAARVPAARVKRALAQLKRRLPDGEPLTGVRISASGKELLVRDGETVWNPDSGQVLFDFAVSEIAARTPAARPAEAEPAREDRLDADGWHALGCELEESAPEKAHEAYRRALELDPRHADTHVNLGRLLHESGDLGAAEAHYRRALATDSAHAIAAFNLAVVLEDGGRLEEAVEAYLVALAVDPTGADTHYRLAYLYERLGKKSAAIRHLSAYRRLVQK